LVNCFYRLKNPTTLAMQWEAICINADFWSQVLQSRNLKCLDFALGAVMATSRAQLKEIGGFAVLADCLADDYQLGNRIARLGYRIELSTVVADCLAPPMDWRKAWTHQLRWARTIRVCQPAPYFFSILSNPTLWPLVWLLVHLTPLTAGVGIGAGVLRIVGALDLQQRLMQSRQHFPYCWLAPIKDLLQAVLWLLAFTGNHIEWRGQRLRLRRDGTLETIRTDVT
jgi:ceramide glucosyltransferase